MGLESASVKRATLLHQDQQRLSSGSLSPSRSCFMDTYRTWVLPIATLEGVGRDACVRSHGKGGA